ncbi:hypothetical protein RRG08_037441 [Elysia crispata]|uniref:Uncharacterized protein n=1 Tax=Elysia crispata TaxID=231223 RepID=A0AAE0Y591_9GAST|nr:hypothetical protein RRG08_037441 [Elysia crispata]
MKFWYSGLCHICSDWFFMTQQILAVKTFSVCPPCDTREVTVWNWLSEVVIVPSSRPGAGIHQSLSRIQSFPAPSLVATRTNNLQRAQAISKHRSIPWPYPCDGQLVHHWPHQSEFSTRFLCSPRFTPVTLYDP